MKEEQLACKRCGNCCRQGGPALHRADLDLITSGKIVLSSLITLRKGEFAHNPQSAKLQPVSVELVKIVGTGRQWDCCYYDKDKGCTIYEYRPQACRVLKCWDTSEILALVEKDTLSRFDILPADDPLVQVIQEHQRLCPSYDFQKNFIDQKKMSAEQKKDLEKLVREDLRFRTRVIADFQLKLSQELFYFGRPLFQLLEPFGVRVAETENGVRLIWEKERSEEE